MVQTDLIGYVAAPLAYSRAMSAGEEAVVGARSSRTRMNRGKRRDRPRPGTARSIAAGYVGDAVTSAARISQTSVGGNHTAGASDPASYRSTGTSCVPARVPCGLP